MSRFQTYLRSTAGELRSAFDRIRTTNTDPGVKGGKNEAALADFLRAHTRAVSIHQRAQVIDSRDQISDELDLIASNEYQPFGGAPEGLILVEGVSFVVQVKAILTREEIRRSVQNCSSFKRITPWFGVGDIVYREFYGLRPHWQAPYLCFCYSSELKDSTILGELDTASGGVNLDKQMDAVFVLDRGWSILNFKAGSEKFKSSSGQRVLGWGLTYTAEDTLLEMLSFIHLTVPTIFRINSPLQGYIEAAVSKPRRGIFRYEVHKPE